MAETPRIELGDAITNTYWVAASCIATLPRLRTGVPVTPPLGVPPRHPPYPACCDDWSQPDWGLEILVPTRGVEPLLPKEPDLKPGASAIPPGGHYRQVSSGIVRFVRLSSDSWCTRQDSNLRSSQGAPGLQPGGFNHSHHSCTSQTFGAGGRT